MSDPQSRRRWISLGEIIGLAALIVSALGVWIAWQSTKQDGPTRIVEQRQSIPLTLRGKVEEDGQALVISPVEPSHAIESLTVTAAGATPIELGSDGRLDADALESALKATKDDKGTLTVPLRIDARYVEAGSDRRSGGRYALRYKWEGGGLFSGRSLRFVGLSR